MRITEKIIRRELADFIKDNYFDFDFEFDCIEFDSICDQIEVPHPDTNSDEKEAENERIVRAEIERINKIGKRMIRDMAREYEKRIEAMQKKLFSDWMNAL